MNWDTPKMFWHNPDRIVEIDGVKLEFSEHPPTEVGEIYVAQRNGAPILLTVAKVVCDGPWKDYIVPKEAAYPYNYNECRKVIGFM